MATFATCGHEVKNDDDLVRIFYKTPSGVGIKYLCPNCANDDKGDFKSMDEGNKWWVARVK